MAASRPTRLLRIIAVASLIGLLAVERRPWPLVPALIAVFFLLLARRRPRCERHAAGIELALAFTLLTLAAMDFYSTDVWPGMRLGSIVLQALPVRVKSGVAEIIEGDCPRARWRSGKWGDVVRDANGFGQYPIAGGGTFSVLLVGDSVISVGFPKIFAEALAAAGLHGDLLDSSMGGYDQGDERCIVEQQLVRKKPDLVILSICLNDFAQRALPANLGGGTREYSWGGNFDERQQNLDHVPLFLESGTRWVEEHRQELLKRYGKAVVFDVADPRLLQSYVGAADFERNRVELTETLQLLHNAQVKTIVLPFPLNYRYAAAADPLYDAILGMLKGTASVDLRPVYAGLSTDDLREVSPGFGADRFLGLAKYHDVVHFGPLAMYLAADATLAAAESQLGMQNLGPGRQYLRTSLATQGAVGARLLERMKAPYGP